MKRAIPVIAFFLMVLAGSGQDARENAAAIGPSLQAAMDQSLPNSGAVGVSVAVMLSGGGLWAGASGISHEGVPLTTDMLFDIASVQKNLQAALDLTLVEQGVLSLDDPVEKWLPPPPHVDGRITIRQLLNMTSGIRDFVEHPRSPYSVGFDNIDFEKMWTWEEIQSVFIGEPNFRPGAKCEYSSTNYIVLKHIIEKAAKSTLPPLVEDRLLKPNRLDHTLVNFSKPIPPAMRIAHGWFDRNGDGTADDISGQSLNWAISLAPMLTYSTPTDMVKWAHALFHKKTVLGEKTLGSMLDFRGPVQGEPLMKGYGLGVVDIDIGAMMPHRKDVRVYGHLGSQFGYMTVVGYFPDLGVSLAIMSNRGCDGDSQRAIATVSGAVIDALLGRLGTKRP